MENIVLNPVKIEYDIDKTEMFKDFKTDSKVYETIVEIIENSGEIIRPRAILKCRSVETVAQGCLALMGQILKVNYYLTNYII